MLDKVHLALPAAMRLPLPHSFRRPRVERLRNSHIRWHMTAQIDPASASSDVSSANPAEVSVGQAYRRSHAVRRLNRCFLAAAVQKRGDGSVYSDACVQCALKNGGLRDCRSEGELPHHHSWCCNGRCWRRCGLSSASVIRPCCCWCLFKSRWLWHSERSSTLT